MQRIKHTNYISMALIACIALVGAIFTYKYSERVVGQIWGFVCSITYFIGCGVFTKKIVYSNSEFWQSKKTYRAAVVAVIILLLILLFVIDPTTNKVDRWSAIHNFLQYLLDGRYPYAAQTHLGGYGSPFPAWQLWHLPYYLMGNIGYSFIVCTILFLYSIRKRFGTISSFKALMILAIYLPFWYEATVVSDLLPNMMLLCAFINIFMMHDEKSNDKRFLVLSAIICGLFLSTRLAVTIPLFFVMFWPWMRQDIGTKVLLLVIPLIIFVITFLPFVLWNGKMLFFFEYNPFILQTRQGDMLDTLVLIASSIFTAVLLCRHTSNILPVISFTMLGFISFVFIHHLLISSHNFFGPAYDHTYLSMFVPFAITYLTMPISDQIGDYRVPQLKENLCNKKIIIP